MKLKTFKVGEINEYINKLLSLDIILSNLQVEGEISNFKLHSSGHMYFSLKDQKSRIRCVMFRSNGQRLKFLPEEGMKVIVKGYISVYERDGQYQLYVQEMQPSGIGALYKAYEQLKEKLDHEGLFREENKREIPFLPEKIGVVTSPTGAAIRDIVSIITRRNPNVKVMIYPALVQGIDAGRQISKGIEYFNEDNTVDVIIMGRGGGSIEELWAFNEEIVARGIAYSHIPIISAVGHETDFTIADFVADVRAATPSAAAELVIPPKQDLQYTLRSLKLRLIQTMENNLVQNRQKIEKIKSSHVFARPYDQLNQYKQQVDWLNGNLIKAMKGKFNIKKEKFQSIEKQLYGISPFSILNRGYSILKNEEDHYVVTIEEVKKGEHLQVILNDGILDCTINDLKKEAMDIRYGE